jgi:kynureninase
MRLPTSRDECKALDADDPLASHRAEFSLPDGMVYLDGNSLGALPSCTSDRVRDVVEQEWGVGLIRSWNDAGWFDKPRVLGDRLAPLVGAGAGQVVVCDSTSVNIFKVVVAALRMRPDRDVIVAEADSFPTDLYMLEGASEVLGGHERRLIGADGPDLAAALDERVAVVVLSHVDYRTGAMYDMAAVTEQVHAAGALMVWDLCHSVGALPVRLDDAGVDFAVGCTYKYLNGGPGSPAFLYAATAHHDAVRQPLSGWHGHARPFDFGVDYAPAPGISRFLVGTPHLLSYAALEASLDLWDSVDLDAVRAKSLALTDLFIGLVERDCPAGAVEVVTPRAREQRGSQVALRHEDGYAVVQALIARRVIGDYRAPSLMRFGFAPLYVGHADVWDAAATLRDVLRDESWRSPEFQRRSLVT